MKIENAAFSKFCKYWESAFKNEQLGYSFDYAFLDNSDWVQDSAVIDRIGYEKGSWHISLVFADPNDSTNFLVRHIRTTSSYQKAKIEAQFLRRTAAKDPRGTVTVSLDTFNCPLN